MSQTTIDTVVIGGGQAGLSTSYHLMQRGREHIVLEQAAQAGNAWRNDRWESFTLVTPNWWFRLPGAEYHGDNPGGFMPRDEIVSAFEAYAEQFHLPVQYGSRVTSVEPVEGERGFRVSVGATMIRANHVAMATGLFQTPKRPAFSSTLPSDITQLASGQYRSPGQLPPGAVLVVGTGQSGCQIADELHQSGRRVYLCVGRAGRFPRRYRGKDGYDWFDLIGAADQLTESLPSPQARFGGNPHVSGRAGGRSLNLHQFARDGVTLLGHLRGGEGDRLALAPDLHECLAQADKFEADYLKGVDRYIAAAGLEAPEEERPALLDGFDLPEPTTLDLRSAGITTIIWAMGYDFDFSLVHAPIFDSAGYPVQKRGITAVPGLYFVGLPWLYKRKSGLLLGVGDDAQYIVEAMTAPAG
jgi:putative flavoprotein involved in K+ transport